MNKILIATDPETTLEDITSITISDKHFVSVIYQDGRVVKYPYNPHFDKDKLGVSVHDRDAGLPQSP